MAVNRYDSPAQAQFMNTYVPIPFEQLYTLGKQAKEDVDKALESYSSALDKWSEFKSPSAIDTKAWYDETVGRAMPVIEEMSKNLDMIKSAEGRAKLYSVINNVDRAKLSNLKQSAEGLTQRQKINQQLMLSGRYNPLWHDVDFNNYDTITSGIYNDLSPLAYSSIRELTDPYVNNIKDSYIGRKDGFIWTGVTGQQLKDILDANKSGILSTPQAQMHIKTWMRTHPGSTEEDAANAFMQKAYTDNQKYIRNNPSIDPYAMQALKYKQAMDTAGLKKGSKESVDYPDAYKKLYSDAATYERSLLDNGTVYSQTREALSRFQQASAALQSGQMSAEEYKSYIQDYNEELKNAIANDVAALFSQKDGEIFPKTGVKPDMMPRYVTAASRTLNDLTMPASGMILNTYNKVRSTNEVEVNIGGSVTKGYISPDTSGSILATDFVDKLMNVPSKKFNVRTVDGLERNFGEDLKSGVFKDVIKTPRGKIMTGMVDGVPQLLQRVTVRIPLSSVTEGEAKYDKDSFKHMVTKVMGIKAETGLNAKPIKTSDRDDMYGKNVPLTGEYFAFDTMEPIDPKGMTRMTFDQEVNEIHGGSKLQNDNYSGSYTDSYEHIITGLLQ